TSGPRHARHRPSQSRLRRPGPGDGRARQPGQHGRGIHRPAGPGPPARGAGPGRGRPGPTGVKDMSTPPESFEVICEVEPATRPDLMHVRHQIGVMSRVATAFLIPDNHIGRATVSSIAVAHEVALMGGRSIACLNARDRNVLGFRRDLLTAAAYGVDEFLFVYGDRPETGARSDDLTVRSMMAESRRFSEGGAHGTGPLRLGVTSGLRPLPAWKQGADFLLTQVTFSLPDLLEWRERVVFAGPVYAGVMVI